MLNGLIEQLSSFIWSDPERRVWKPKEGLTVSQWAAKYRFVTKGPAQGLWSNELTPYLVEPMDAWNLPWVRHIILCFAPQTGKTSVAINCLLYLIDQDPGPVMYIHAFGERDYRIIKRKNLARYTCIDCSDDWDDGRRNEAVRCGKWVATSGVERPRCLMFGELPSWYSPFVSLSTVLGEFFKSKDDPQKYMAYVTQHQARAWKEVLDKKDDHQILSHRTDMEPGIVPPECISLTAGIDMQKYGFWFVVRAWEPDLTSHLVQYGQLSTWEEVDYLVLESRYEKQDGNGSTMGIWRAALDTGGGKSSEGEWSRTEEAYQWLRSRRPGIVFGTKGASRPQLKRVTVSTIDKMPSSNRPIPGGLQLRLLDVDQFKDLIHRRLSRKRERTSRHPMLLSAQEDR